MISIVWAGGIRSPAVRPAAMRRSLPGLKLHPAVGHGAVESLDQRVVVVVDPQGGRRIPGLVNLGPAFGTHHRSPVGPGAVARRQRGGDRPGSVVKDRGDLPVCSGLVESRQRGDGVGLAEDVPGERDRVDPEIEQRAAAELQRVETVGRIVGQLLGGGQRSPSGSAKRARGDDLVQPQHVRQEPRPHGFKRDKALCRGHVHDLGGLGRVEGEGLLHEDVLAGLECQLGRAHVLGVRGRDIDDVDLRVGHQRLVAAMRRADAEPAANASAFAWLREPTAVTVWPSSIRSLVKSSAIQPVARIPQRTCSVTSSVLSVRSSGRRVQPASLRMASATIRWSSVSGSPLTAADPISVLPRSMSGMAPPLAT